VQALARTLAASKAELMTQYRAAFAAGDLASARRTLAQLHTLDAFDPELETEARALGDALRSEVSKQIAMGRRGFASGNFTAAQTAFEAVLELDPDNESAQGYISYIATLRQERSRSGKSPSGVVAGDTFASQAEIRAEGFYRTGRCGAPATTTRRSASSCSRWAQRGTPARSRAGRLRRGPRSRADRERRRPSATRTSSRRSTSGAWRCSSIRRTSARAPTSVTPSASSRTSSGCGRNPIRRRGWSSRMEWLARPLWIALALALGTGCAGGLDFAGMQRTLANGARPATPALIEGSPIALPPPDGVSAMSGELRTVPLRWDPVIGGDVGGYIVERAFAAEGPFMRVAVLAGSNTTLWVDNGAKGAGTRSSAALGDGVTAFYRVRCFAESGRIGAEASGVVSAATAQPPEPPGGLRAYSHQPRQVPLSWKASDDPDVTAYRVYRSPSFRGPFEPLATVDGRFQTIYADTGLGDLRVFYYASRNRAGGEPPPSRCAGHSPSRCTPSGQRGGAAARREPASWQPNVETNLVGYRLPGNARGRKRTNPSQRWRPTDRPRTRPSGRRARLYQLVAVDEDGSRAIPAGRRRHQRGLRAERHGPRGRRPPQLNRGSTRLPRRTSSARAVSRSEIGFVTGASFVDAGAKPGGQYRYTVVLERADATSPRLLARRDPRPGAMIPLADFRRAFLESPPESDPR
jgi:hypothetical protein